MEIIKSTNLCKIYKDEKISKQAIINCNVNIMKGEFTAICGASYSGKTTLLRLLGGYERPSCGEVYINQNNIAVYNEDELAFFRRREVGYLLPNDSLISELTVHENIILPAILAQKEYDKKYYKILVKCMHISDILSVYPKQLTNNQLQCVSCVRALINRPGIILMDEPANESGCQISKEVLNYLLYEVFQYQKTLIMVTNNPVVCSYANHIIKMKQGIIIEDRAI